ncbi:MAG TPA: transcriptional regulator, partial [Bacteroidetes bacterium]|nr:transcriptional regulator [Bacteroidota bacterium]
ELCVYLSLKRDSIYRLLKNNDLPGHKVGKSWRFQVSEIDAWIKSGKAGE